MSNRLIGLAAASFLFSLLNLVALTTNYKVSTLLILLDGVFGIALLIFLSIVTIPTVLRAALIMAIFISYLALSTKIYFFQLSSTQQGVQDRLETKRLDEGSTNVNLGSPTLDGSKAQPQSRANGASVHFDEKRDAGNWAKRMNTELDHSIGGDEAASISIRGVISSKSDRADHSIEIIWSIALGGMTEQCGRSSVVGSDETVLVDQISKSIRMAVERTTQTHQPACY